MRRIIIAVLAVLCLLALGVMYYSWPKIKRHYTELSKPSPEQEAKDLETLQKLLSEQKWEEAQTLIRKYDANINNTTPEGKKWLEGLVIVSENLSDARQIDVIHQYYPVILEGREMSAILLGNLFIVQKKNDEFDKLRKEWVGKETKEIGWLQLDVGRLMEEEETDNAINLIKSKKFEGKDEVVRLEMLAAVLTQKNPQEAWETLNKAIDLDPENASLRVFRGRLLEAASKPSFALSEYIASVQLQPDSLVLKDQLAEFFIRVFQYPSAMDIWKTMIEDNKFSDIILLKSWFWSHMTFPMAIDWEKLKVPTGGPLEPYVSYVLNLQKDRFWDTKEFDQIPNRNKYLKTQQSSYWMRLVEFLRVRDEKSALELVEGNLFKDNLYNPELNQLIHRILAYRKTGSLALKQATIPVILPPDKDMYTFYIQVEVAAEAHAKDPEGYVIPKAVEEILKSNDAFSIAFLAAGWNEAALALQTIGILPETFPDWVGVTYTYAISQNRGIDKALLYASKQKKTDLLMLMVGKLYAANKEQDKALAVLEPLTKLKNNLGQQALWLTVGLYADKKDYIKAKSILAENPNMEKSDVGQEILARIALIQGDQKGAEKIYFALKDRSTEAKSYFAHQAFKNKDWEEARRLTIEILQQSPTDITARQNLYKIMEEEKKAKGNQ
jgi:predicted Zn-dependent protease